MDRQFEQVSTAFNDEFKAKTVGLVSINEFRKAKETVAMKELEEQEKLRQEVDKKKQKRVKLRKKKRAKATLSFAVGELEGEEDMAASPVAAPKGAKKPKDKAPVAATASAAAGGGEGGAAATEAVKKKRRKDPSVRTDFLPDHDRERREAELRAKYKVEWLQQQEKIKRDKLSVTYSYWDGSGHRRDIIIPKGTTIGKFLEWVRQDLCSEFRELNSVSAENLLYIKEDLIIPHHYSFYDLIVSKARGKSGPLFHFDVHDDVRIRNDATIEKDESHPGKIVERHWYESNKHIFPASRWEVYDPNIKREKYTIHGGEIRG